MERGLILLVATLMVCLAPGVHGTFHLMFAPNATVDITRAGCGVSKLCVETPEGCDPALNGNCLFTSLMTTTPVAPNGTNLTVELRGESAGYIALGLTENPSQGISLVFVCTRNRTSNPSFFSTRKRNNTDTTGTLIPVETIVKEIRGSVTGNVIRCEFTIPRFNATSTRTRTSAATTLNVLLGSGTANGGVIGALTVNLNSGPLDVSNPAANVNPTATANATMATATVAATTAGASGASQPHVVLVLLSALIGSAMLRT